MRFRNRKFVFRIADSRPTTRANAHSKLRQFQWACGFAHAGTEFARQKHDTFNFEEELCKL
ncbi:MAG: hypothetical protein DMG97_34715 [Acidobacteria bacterium]|nr:MAG: hypothetical protein DMG97_34715 [Acidobacteriota bacterium]PYV73499.1 MAG: hypothetical protein DMG96_23025 [Acidobacteriota bacterium]